MKKTEKQHNAPPMPAHRFNATQSIAKHFHAIGLPMAGLKQSPTMAINKATLKEQRQAQAQATAKPPYSRQEAKRRAEEALALHREGKPAKAPLAKKSGPSRKDALDLLRAKLPRAHSADRIAFAQRLYAARVESLKANQPTPLADKHGSVTSYDPRPKGLERFELSFQPRGAVPVGL